MEIKSYTEAAFVFIILTIIGCFLIGYILIILLLKVIHGVLILYKMCQNRTMLQKVEQLECKENKSESLESLAPFVIR